MGPTYYAAVLERLHRLGCIGAFAWCFGDYAEALWDRPPCDLQKHERFFGLYRADGSLKPMGEVVRDFAASEPPCAGRSGHSCCRCHPTTSTPIPSAHLPDLYARFLAG